MCLSRNYMSLSVKSPEEENTPYKKLSASRNRGLVIPVHFKCGMCLACYRRISNDWAVRVYYHSLDNPPTYHVMLSRADWHDNIYLNYKDIQNFHKRLRKKTKQKFTYFVSLEYGKTGKPHYHIIYFGLRLYDITRVERRANGYDIYNSPTIHDTWGHGVSRIQLVDNSEHLITYLIKYSTKRYWFNTIKQEWLRQVNSLPSWQGKSLSDILKRLRELSKINLKGSLEWAHYVSNPLYLKYMSLKRLLNARKERIHSSTGLGYNSMKSRLKSIVRLDVVYINGIKYNLPHCWLVKIYNEYYGKDDEVVSWVLDRLNDIEYQSIEELKEIRKEKLKSQSNWLRKEAEDMAIKWDEFI